GLAREIRRYAAAEEGLRLPEDHRDWILHTRLINANFRVGGPDNAADLLAYAAQRKLPAPLREQALHALLEWRDPKPVDATTGMHRPLDASARPDIAPAVREGLPAVFAAAEGALVGLATRLALDYGAPAPVGLLKEQILDSSAESQSRVSSL